VRLLPYVCGARFRVEVGRIVVLEFGVKRRDESGFEQSY